MIHWFLPVGGSIIPFRQSDKWCAYAVSLGRVAPIDVNTFSIVNGRLVLQHNSRAVAGWNKDVPGITPLPWRQPVF